MLVPVPVLEVEVEQELAEVLVTAMVLALEVERELAGVLAREAK